MDYSTKVFNFQYDNVFVSRKLDICLTVCHNLLNERRNFVKSTKTVCKYEKNCKKARFHHC